MQGATDMCYLSAGGLAAAIRDRHVSCVEVFDAVVARIEAINPLINAYCTLSLDEARAAALRADTALIGSDAVGPLHGVPVAIKDDLAVAGLRYTEGSLLYAERVATYDDLTVQRLKTAGAIVLGKTNEPEFGHKATTDNLLFGTTYNPWNRECTAGGSSGGSAAAVAAGMAYLALGTDAGGSVRIPAAFCGIVGHKPSLGRIPRIPAPNAYDTVWSIGPLARGVADTALALRVLAGPDERDPFALPALAGGELDLDADLHGLRVAWSPSIIGMLVGREAAVAAEAATWLLAERGAVVQTIEEVLTPPREAWTDLYSAGYAEMLGDSFEVVRDRLAPTFVEIVERGKAVGLRQYLAAQAAVTRFVEESAALFDRFDLIATPTAPVPAFAASQPLGPDRIDDHEVNPQLGWAFTWPFNLTGHPAIAIPSGWSTDGLPLSLQLVGARRADGLVLRAAAAIEAAAPWSGRRPSIA